MTSVPVCVFAKPPRPGEVKTRLASVLGGESAAALAAAFLRDTWLTVGRLSWARPVLATTDVEWGRAEGLCPTDDVWAQGEGDLGARLERVLGRALATSPGALAIGTDSPGLPLRALEQARAAVEDGWAVLGPAEDGGYYLLGLPRCPPGLLADLPWSTAETRARTDERLRDAGLRVRMLETWFDVDRPEDLAHLKRRLASGEVRALHTATLLASLEEAR